jgi:hypothetical protein
MQMNDTPSPEAIVKAALERAAGIANCSCINHCENYPQKCGLASANRIRNLASDPAEVVEIIMAAGGTND